MSIIESIILGIIQGIAEFLPISSSGHLLIARKWMGLNDVPRLFDVLLHVATLIVVVWIYRHRILQLLLALVRPVRKSPPQQRKHHRKDLMLVLFLILSTMATVVIVLVLDRFTLSQWSWLTPVAFIFTGFFLLMTRFVPQGFEKEQPNGLMALFIGIAQGFGTIAGISRSGITIGTARFFGLERERAGEYSFLLSIPAIIGALILDLKDGVALVESIPLTTLIISFVTTLVVGYFSLRLLLRIIKSGKFYYFSFYLIPLGAGLLILGL